MPQQKTAKIPHHLGITASTDTFWQAQERYDSYTGYLLRSKRGAIDEWRALNVMNFEMEASALFVMASTWVYMQPVFAELLQCVMNQKKYLLIPKKEQPNLNWETLAVEGIRQSMKSRGLIK